MRKPTQTIIIIDLSGGDGCNYEELLQQDSKVRYRCFIASSETQTLALSQSHQFDTILLDSQNCDRYASAVIESLKTQMGENCPPIIVIDRNDARLATRAIKAGAVDYLVREQLSRDILVQSLQEAIASNPKHSSHYETNQIEGVTIDNTEAIEAEIALQESEAKYRSLFDSIDQGFCIIEMIFDENNLPVDYRFLEINPSFEKQTGLVRAQGKRMRELAAEHENYWFEIYGKIALTGESVRFENYASQLHRWFEVYAFRFGEPASRKVAILFNDISDRKQTEEQQAFLLKFSDTLRAEPNADSVANRAVRMLAEHLHLDRCWLSKVFEPQDISTVGPEYRRLDLPPMSGVFRLSDYPETMRQLATQPMVIHDVVNDPSFSDSEKAMLSQLHLQALLVASLRRGQHQVIWALAAAMSTPRHWKESERVLLEQVSERTWAAIERARAETALREAELQRVREQERAETLAELDRVKTEFFSNISHEFRTPLTLLLAPLEDVLRDLNYPLPKPQRERLELAHRNSLRLLKLVNSLLDFSRVEAGRLQANYEPTDLAAYTVDDVVPKDRALVYLWCENW